MIFRSIKDYLKAKEAYLNTPGKIINGRGFYVVKGRLVPDKEYFKHNSRPVYEPPPKENPDKTKLPPSTIC